MSERRFDPNPRRVVFIVKNAAGAVLARKQFIYERKYSLEEIQVFADSWRGENHPDSASVEVLDLTSGGK